MRTAAAFSLLALMLCASPALADETANAPQEFAALDAVSDPELATIRGGFLNVNGVLIDFSFTSRIAIDGAMQSSIAANTASLIKAQATHAGHAATVQDLLPPSVIQNASNNTQIAMQQVLDLSIHNAVAAMANHAQFEQAALQNARAFR